MPTDYISDGRDGTELNTFTPNDTLIRYAILLSYSNILSNRGSRRATVKHDSGCVG